MYTDVLSVLNILQRLYTAQTSACTKLTRYLDLPPPPRLLDLYIKWYLKLCTDTGNVAYAGITDFVNFVSFICRIRAMHAESLGDRIEQMKQKKTEERIREIETQRKHAELEQKRLQEQQVRRIREEKQKLEEEQRRKKEEERKQQEEEEEKRKQKAEEQKRKMAEDANGKGDDSAILVKR